MERPLAETIQSMYFCSIRDPLEGLLGSAKGSVGVCLGSVRGQLGPSGVHLGSIVGPSWIREGPLEVHQESIKGPLGLFRGLSGSVRGLLGSNSNQDLVSSPIN